MYGKKSLIGPVSGKKPVYRAEDRAVHDHLSGGGFRTQLDFFRMRISSFSQKLSGLTHFLSSQSERPGVFDALHTNSPGDWTKGHFLVPKWDDERGYASKARACIARCASLHPRALRVRGQDMVQR